MISGIYICICSRSLVILIQCVRINQDLKFYSDHAPLTVEITTNDALDLETINRAMQLTNYSHFNPPREQVYCKRPVRIEDIDTEKFTTHLCALPLPEIADIDTADTDDIVNSLNSLFYDTFTRLKEEAVACK